MRPPIQCPYLFYWENMILRLWISWARQFNFLIDSFKEIIIFLAISFVGFFIISLGKYRSIDLYGAKINLYLVALLMGNLKGFLYSIQEELTYIY